jgi:dihydroorotate dehydrogenase (fumarate)
MVDLRTKYLGLDLINPFMPGASPLVDDLDVVRRLEDAGAPAIVMHSLFEEQIISEQISTFHHIETHSESYPEALCYLPSPDRFALGPEEYLEHLASVKAAVGVPVIASLNGTTPGGWLQYARHMEQAGADALELNVYSIASDPNESAAEAEQRTIDMVRSVKATVRLPVAVKLSPFYTSLPHFAKNLEAAGADGLILFNRFYEPNLDPEALQAERHLSFSTPAELPLRLRWLAILSNIIRPSLAVSGGVHGSTDAIKAIMTGAHAVQMVSALLRHGPDHLRRVREEVALWMEEHEYPSVDALRGCMNLGACPDPAAYERVNYVLMLQGWRGQ